MAKPTTKREREQARAEASTRTATKNKGLPRTAKAGERRSAKVMGVTIPKALTDALDSLVNSQRGRELLASALVAAAGAAAAALVQAGGKKDERDTKTTAAEDRETATATNDLALAAAGALAEMATRAVTRAKVKRRA